MSSPPIVHIDTFETTLTDRDNLVFTFNIIVLEDDIQINFSLSDKNNTAKVDYSFGSFMQVELDGPLESYGTISKKTISHGGQELQVLWGDFFWKSVIQLAQNDIPTNIDLHFEGYMITLPSTT